MFKSKILLILILALAAYSVSAAECSECGAHTTACDCPSFCENSGDTSGTCGDIIRCQPVAGRTISECSSFTDGAVCTSSPGCSFCSGSGTCSSLTSAGKNTCKKQPDCSWDETDVDPVNHFCTGSAKSCFDIGLDPSCIAGDFCESDCNSAALCSWDTCDGAVESCQSRTSEIECQITGSNCFWIGDNIDQDQDIYTKNDICRTGETLQMDFWLLDVADRDGICPPTDCIDEPGDCAGAGYTGEALTWCQNNPYLIHPGVFDFPNDGIDQDCNGADSTKAIDCDSSLSACVYIHKFDNDVLSEHPVDFYPCYLQDPTCKKCDRDYGLTDPCVRTCSGTDCWKLGKYKTIIKRHSKEEFEYSFDFDNLGETKCNNADWYGSDGVWRDAGWLGAGGDLNCCGDDRPWVYEGIAFRLYETAAASRESVFRVFNDDLQDSFFLGQSSQANLVNLEAKGYSWETFLYAPPSTGTTGDEVWALYNPLNGDRIFTTDTNEKNTLVGAGIAADWHPTQTFRALGPTESPSTTIAVHRFYNPDKGIHYFTKDESEIVTLTDGPEIFTCGSDIFTACVDSNIVKDADEDENVCIGCGHYPLDGNLGGLAWNEELDSNNCCGNEETDCGISDGPNLCYMDDTSSRWIAGTQGEENSVGTVINMPCDDSDYTLLPNLEWVPCKENSFMAPFSPTKLRFLIGDVLHEYLCKDSEILACCGPDNTNEDCLVPLSNARTTTDGPVTIGTDTFYCTSSFTWTTQPDVDEASCIASTNPVTSTNNVWTGTKCCGDDGLDDDYSDHLGIGACLNGAVIPNGDKAANDLIVENGLLYGCVVDTSDFPDMSEDIITPSDRCEIISNNFCSYSGDWSTEISTRDNPTYRNRTATKHESISGGTTSACCEVSECWDSRTCVSHGTIINQNYACINGDWEDRELRWKWDFSENGYCLSNDQCLVEDLASATDKCIDSGEYIFDHYCEEGNWTSRTKLLATTLLDIAADKVFANYTLFCDTYDTVLNYLDYESFNFPVGSRFTKDLAVCSDPNVVETKSCVNKVCVMEFPLIEFGEEVVVFATSLNNIYEEEDVPLSYLNTFLRAYHETYGDIDCSSAMDNDGLFHSCDGADARIWWNNKLQMIITSSTAITTTDIPGEFGLAGLSFTQKIAFFFSNPFENIFNFIKGVLNDPDRDPSFNQKLDLDQTVQSEIYGFIRNTTEFSRIYLARDGPRSIRGISEEIYVDQEDSGKNKNYTSITYTCINEDVCGSVSTFDAKAAGDGERISCTTDVTGINSYVISRFPSGRDTWLDLTAKTRLSGTSNTNTAAPNIITIVSNPALATLNPDQTEAEFDLQLLGEGCVWPFTYLWDLDDNSNFETTTEDPETSTTISVPQTQEYDPIETIANIKAKVSDGTQESTVYNLALPIKKLPQKTNAQCPKILPRRAHWSDTVKDGTFEQTWTNGAYSPETKESIYNVAPNECHWTCDDLYYLSEYDDPPIEEAVEPPPEELNPRPKWDAGCGDSCGEGLFCLDGTCIPSLNHIGACVSASYQGSPVTCRDHNYDLTSEMCTLQGENFDSDGTTCDNSNLDSTNPDLCYIHIENSVDNEGRIFCPNGCVFSDDPANLYVSSCIPDRDTITPDDEPETSAVDPEEPEACCLETQHNEYGRCVSNKCSKENIPLYSVPCEGYNTGVLNHKFSNQIVYSCFGAEKCSYKCDIDTLLDPASGECKPLGTIYEVGDDVPDIVCDYLINNQVQCTITRPNSYTSEDGIELFWRYYDSQGNVLADFCGEWSKKASNGCVGNSDSSYYDSIYYDATTSSKTITFTADYSDLAHIGLWTRGWEFISVDNYEPSGWSNGLDINIIPLIDCSYSSSDNKATCQITSYSYDPTDGIELFWRYYDANGNILKDFCGNWEPNIIDHPDSNCAELGTNQNIFYNPTTSVRTITFEPSFATYPNLASFGIWSKGWKKDGADWDTTPWSKEELTTLS